MCNTRLIHWSQSRHQIFLDWWFPYSFQRSSVSLLGVDVNSIDIISDTNLGLPLFHSVPGDHDPIICTQFGGWSYQSIPHFVTHYLQATAKVFITGYTSRHDLNGNPNELYLQYTSNNELVNLTYKIKTHTSDLNCLNTILNNFIQKNH